MSSLDSVLLCCSKSQVKNMYYDTFSLPSLEHSRYEKERLEEYVEPRRERRSPVASSRPAREVERKESHRHRDYER